MKQEEVNDIAVKTAKILIDSKYKSTFKSFLNKKSDSQTVVENLPEYYPTYKICAQLLEDNTIHLQKGYFAAKLFIKKAPNMTPDEYEYIKANYKQTTLSVGIDYINTISRAWSDGNWSVTFEKDDDVFVNTENTFEDYIKKEIKFFTSLENWGKQILPSLKTKDANGLIITKPEFKIVLDEELNPVLDSDGRSILTDDLTEAQPVYIPCTRVLSSPNDDYALIDLTDYSANKLKLEYELYAEDEIWSIKQINDDASKPKFEVTLIFNHQTGRKLYHRLGGIPQVYENEVYYQSLFSYATDILDLALMNAQILQVIINKCGFPVTVMVGNVCDFNYVVDGYPTQRCVDGEVFDSALNRKIKCPSCGGSGLKSRLSPTSTFLVRPNQNITPGDNITPKDSVGFVAPDTEILTFLENKIDKDLLKAMSILHIRVSSSVVKTQNNTETATGMTIDERAMQTAIKLDSDQMFTLVENVSIDIGKLRYADKFKPATWIYPIQVELKTEQDYIKEIDTAAKSGMPPVGMYPIISRYLKSNFFDDGKGAKYLEIILTADRLLGLSQTDIVVKLNKGLVEPYEVIIHDSALSLLREIDLENEKFTDLSLAEQVKIFIDKAKTKAIVEDETGKAIEDVLKVVPAA